MDKRTQQAAILEYIEQHGSVTIRDIQTELQINGATARISELRERGYNILDRWEKGQHCAPFKAYFRGPDEFNQKGASA